MVKPVTVAILSKRDDAYWMKDSLRYFGVELSFDQASADLNPNVYTQFRLHTGSPGPDGKLNQELLKKISEVLERGQRIRASAGPDSETGWQALYDAKVSFIHTDKLVELKEFMKKKQAGEK